MIFNPNAIKFDIEVTKEELSKILDLDNEVDVPLYQELEKIEGVSEIDYDGHFGPYIFLTVDLEHLDGSTKKIKEVIKKFLDKEI